MKDIWDLYKGKKVRLIIEDNDKRIKARDGIFYATDHTHIFICVIKRDDAGNFIEYSKMPTPFLRDNVIRIDVKEEINE